MIHANIAYRLPIPTELDKLDYLMKANIGDRRFEVSKLSEEVQTELRVLGYKIFFNSQKSMYIVSW